MVTVSVSPQSVVPGGVLTVTIGGVPLTTYYPFSTGTSIFENIAQNGQPVSTNLLGQGTIDWYIANNAPPGTYDLRVADGAGFTVAQTTFTVSSTGGGGSNFDSLGGTVSVDGADINVSAQLMNSSTGQNVAKSGEKISVNVDGFYTGLTMTTNSQGRATGSLSAASYAAGSHTIRMYSDSQPLAGITLNFTIQPQTVSVASIELSADRNMISGIDNEVTFVILVKGSDGLPMPDVSARLVLDGVTTASFTPPTDSTGIASVTLPLDTSPGIANHTVRYDASGKSSNTLTIGVQQPGGGDPPGGMELDPMLIAAGAILGGGLIGVATGFIKVPKKII